LLCATKRPAKLAYVYFENEPGRRSAAKLLTKDEAGFARLVGADGVQPAFRDLPADLDLDQIAKSRDLFSCALE